jgi:hypothetical protein
LLLLLLLVLVLLMLSQTVQEHTAAPNQAALAAIF